jgi:tRNA U34 5-methylaminomethyl-2-thiouridine-forming methyltransferase MnmC
MHSQVGPWIEANRVYVDQSDLEKVPEGGEPFVLYDVGMGTAANAIALIEKWRALGNTRRLGIISFEKHPEALESALGFQFDFLQSWKEPLRKLLNHGRVTLPGLEWQLVKGDFLTVDFLKLPCPDLIYFDFYSPASCPELWTEEVFSRLSRSSKLITYASNKSVRAAMLLAGFYVGHGTSTSMKLETTVAGRWSSVGGENPLGRDWLESLARSPKNFPMDRLRAHPQFSESHK